MQSEKHENISLSLRLGVSLDVTPEELETLKQEDKAAEALLKNLIHSDRCVANGDTYFPEPWNDEFIEDDLNFDLPFIPLHPEPKPDKVYMFCEEYEDDSCIREFFVHAVSRDKEGLRELMKAKIEKDEYGIIARNGVARNLETWFKTEFEDGTGSLEYYILEEDVLDRDEINKMLKTDKYIDRFEYADNMREILTPMLNNFLKDKGNESIDTGLAIESVLLDKEFQGLLKTSWWGDLSHIDASHRGLMRVIERDFIGFIRDRLSPEAGKPTLDEMIEEARAKITEGKNTTRGRDMRNDER